MNHAIYADSTPFKQETVPVVLITTLALIMLIGLFLVTPRFGSWVFIFLPNPWGIGLQIIQAIITVIWFGYSLLSNRRQPTQH